MTDKEVWAIIKRLLNFPDGKICKHHVCTILLEALEKGGTKLDPELVRAIVNAEDDKALDLLDKEKTIKSSERGTMKTDSNILASELVEFADVKTARMIVPEETGTTPTLQRIVGDPDDQVITPFSQFKPQPGIMQLPNPLSPIEGDEIFYAYLIAGARFQAHDGSWWQIVDYNFNNFSVEIENVWYPRIHAVVNIWDVRRAIHSYIEPVQVLIPPPPPGLDSYDVQRVKIINNK